MNGENTSPLGNFLGGSLICIIRFTTFDDSYLFHMTVAFVSNIPPLRLKVSHLYLKLFRTGGTTYPPWNFNGNFFCWDFQYRFSIKLDGSSANFGVFNIFDSYLRALGVNFVARPLTSKLKICKKALILKFMV